MHKLAHINSHKHKHAFTHIHTGPERGSTPTQVCTPVQSVNVDRYTSTTTHLQSPYMISKQTKNKHTHLVSHALLTKPGQGIIRMFKLISHSYRHTHTNTYPHSSTSRSVCEPSVHLFQRTNIPDSTEELLSLFHCSLSSAIESTRWKDKVEQKPNAPRGGILGDRESLFLSKAVSLRTTKLYCSLSSNKIQKRASMTRAGGLEVTRLGYHLIANMLELQSNILYLSQYICMYEKIFSKMYMVSP